MDKYAKGKRQEYKAKRILEEQGYQVKRSLLSRGTFDLLAKKGDIRLMVQVTCNHKPRPEKMERIKKYPVGPLEFKEVWIFKDRNPVPRIIRV